VGVCVLTRELKLTSVVLQFDSLVQTLGGFNVQEAEAYAEYVRATRGEDEAETLPPYRALPMQALDHAAGHLLAFGIAAALCKTVTVRTPSFSLKKKD
jgi:hypothetical protein